jgi:comEA protein
VDGENLSGFLIRGDNMRNRSLSRGAGTVLALLVLLLSPVAMAVAADEDAGSRDKVNINRAGQEELESLPGIGPHLAAEILEYREKLGPFQRVEDLMSVRGIGEKKFLQLKDLITVGEKPPRK